MNTKIESLFIAYLEKTISQEDEKVLFQWLKNNPDSLVELRQLRNIWNAAGMVGSAGHKQTEKAWSAFLQKVNQAAPQKQLPQNTLRYWIPRVAAVFLLGALMAFAISYAVFTSSQSQTVFQEIVAPAGAKSKITLPDGSTVWLNAGSSIRYSNRFGEKQRELELSGEAYFDVVTNRSKVFLVKTSELNIKAYGTTFNVKSYPDEKTVETTLLSGSIGVQRVGLNKKSDEVVLQPNQQVVYYKSNPDEKPVDARKSTPNSPLAASAVKNENKLTYMISKGIKAEKFTAWKDGVLVINSESLNDLAVKLERKYDVEITFDQENLKEIKFTGTLQNETVEQVLEAIGIAANIDFHVKDRSILFTEKK